MAPPAQQKQSGFEQLPTAVKLLLLALLLGVVSAIYFFALHMSLADEIEQADNQHQQLQQQMQEAQQRQQEYLRLTQELAAREAVDIENKRVLPEDAEIAAFLQDLNRLAELSGLSIQLVEPRPEEAEAQYVRLPVSLRLKGRYHQLAKFFYNVSRLERAVNMENVVMSEPTMDADAVVLDIAVLATTFRRPTGAAGGAGGDGPGGERSGGGMGMGMGGMR